MSPKVPLYIVHVSRVYGWVILLLLFFVLCIFITILQNGCIICNNLEENISNGVEYSSFDDLTPSDNNSGLENITTAQHLVVNFCPPKSLSLTY